MKTTISLKLSNDQVLATCKLLELLEGVVPTTTINEKLTYSIVLEVYALFYNKKKNIIKKASLFDEKAKTKITLKYYEAFGLSLFFNTFLDTVNDHYSQTILNKMDAEIKQKLA